MRSRSTREWAQAAPRLDHFGLRLLAVLSLAQVTACGSVETDATPKGSPFPCKDGKPAGAGYETCSGGWNHRPNVSSCPSSLPRSTTCEGSGSGGEGGGGPVDMCAADANCAERPNGHCDLSQQQFGGSMCLCSYGCTSDADCGTGQICVCGDPVGHCAKSDCTSDAECGNGLLCSTYTVDPGCGGTAFACQTPTDECASDGDCPEGEQCTLENGKHACVAPTCAIGRPFLVASAPRLAPAAERGDWRDADVRPDVAALTPSERAALAEHWTRTALMEHASVAAFARFALELLSLGAPAELAVQAQEAMRDEIHHARLAFALASAYKGTPVGPGRLAIDGALDGQTPEQILATAIREGCIGESVAAIEAAEAAREAQDPIVRSILERVAADEARHAELAWRFVAWMVEQGGESARREARRAFASALAEENLGPSDPGAETEARPWLRHGIVRDALSRSLRAEVIRRVIEPTARRLLAGERGVRSRAAERVTNPPDTSA